MIIFGPKYLTMKKIIAFFIAGAFLASCGGGNSGTTTTDEMEEHEGHDHDGHDHDSDIPKMADLPAVPEGAGVGFGNLEDGATVSSPFYVAFEVMGMEVEPAGIVNEGKGHHHIIIDGSFIEPGGAVPADSVNIHYGGGQLGDTLTLSPGAHTLTMQFADGLHRSYGEQMSKTIGITVE